MFWVIIKNIFIFCWFCSCQTIRFIAFLSSLVWMNLSKLFSPALSLSQLNRNMIILCSNWWGILSMRSFRGRMIGWRSRRGLRRKRTKMMIEITTMRTWGREEIAPAIGEEKKPKRVVKKLIHSRVKEYMTRLKQITNRPMNKTTSAKVFKSLNTRTIKYFSLQTYYLKYKIKPSPSIINLKTRLFPSLITTR